MITVEELDRVNVINSNLHRLETLDNIFKNIANDSLINIADVFSSKDFRTLISEYIPIIQADLMSEYNSIIISPKANSLSHS